MSKGIFLQILVQIFFISSQSHPMKEDDDSDSSVESSYSGLESESDTSGSSDLEENNDVEETVSHCVLW